MDNQAIFNGVWNRFVEKQAVPGVEHFDLKTPVYRALDPTGEVCAACAIGMWDDDGWLDELEGMTIVSAHSEDPEAVEAVFGNDLDLSFLTEIQYAHDEAVDNFYSSDDLDEEDRLAVFHACIRYNLKHVAIRHHFAT